MKKGNVMWLLLLAAAAVFIAAPSWFMHRGFSAREQPSVFETYPATSVRNLAVPSRAKHEKNPFVPSSELLAEASAHFADRCAVCNADDGDGDTLFGKGLYPKPPDMRDRLRLRGKRSRFLEVVLQARRTKSRFLNRYTDCKHNQGKRIRQNRCPNRNCDRLRPHPQRSGKTGQ
jgi:hypothetical protein